jgi:hypothetical protein
MEQVLVMVETMAVGMEARDLLVEFLEFCQLHLARK